MKVFGLLKLFTCVCFFVEVQIEASQKESHVDVEANISTDSENVKMKTGSQHKIICYHRVPWNYDFKFIKILPVL